MRPHNSGKPRLQRLDHFGGIIHRQRGLRHESQLARIAHLQPRHILRHFDQQHLACGQLAHGANRLRVPRMADHHDLQPGLVMPLRLDMHLADQGAGGIHIDHLARLSRRRHRFRHAMGGKDHRPVARHLVQLLDKDRTLGAQPIDDEFVVHDLVAHKDGCPPFLQRHLDDLDGTVHTGAEPARGGQIKGKGRFGHRTLLSGAEVKPVAPRVQPPVASRPCDLHPTARMRMLPRTR